MLIALFIWILIGVGIMVCIPGIRKVTKSYLEVFGFWYSLFYVTITILVGPIAAISGIVKGLRSLNKR